jgi:hypothetical protein
MFETGVLQWEESETGVLQMELLKPGFCKYLSSKAAWGAL